VGVEKFGIVAAFFVGAVVTGENHQGVVVEAQALQAGHQLADILIHAGDHGGETFFGLGPGLIFVRTEVGDFHAVAGGLAELIVGVRNGVGQVQEERGPLAAFNEIDGARGQQIVRILTLHAVVFGNIKLALVFPQMVGIKGVGVALIEIAEPFVEALEVGNAGSAGAAESPLAEDAGAVTGALEDVATVTSEASR
jgi:hypothetical protein